MRLRRREKIARTQKRRGRAEGDSAEPAVAVEVGCLLKGDLATGDRPAGTPRGQKK